MPHAIAAASDGVYLLTSALKDSAVTESVLYHCVPSMTCSAKMAGPFACINGACLTTADDAVFVASVHEERPVIVRFMRGESTTINVDPAVLRIDGLAAVNPELLYYAGAYSLRVGLGPQTAIYRWNGSNSTVAVPGLYFPENLIVVPTHLLWRDMDKMMRVDIGHDVPSAFVNGLVVAGPHHLCSTRGWIVLSDAGQMVAVPKGATDAAPQQIDALRGPVAFACDSASDRVVYVDGNADLRSIDLGVVGPARHPSPSLLPAPLGPDAATTARLVFGGGAVYGVWENAARATEVVRISCSKPAP